MNPNGFDFSNDPLPHVCLPEPERTIARLRDRINELKRTPKSGAVRLELAKNEVYLKMALRHQEKQEWTFHSVNESSNTKAKCE
jgi:hypothetical protein